MPKAEADSPRRKGNRQRVWLNRLPRPVVILIAVFLALVLISVGGAASVVFAVNRRHPDFSRLYTPPGQSSRIYAANGELIASLFTENRVTIPLDEIPRHVRQAVIAIEDARFYKHHGVDPVGVGRALLHNVRARQAVEGGSTITQQLARAVFLSRKKVLSRKLAEMALAVEIERRLAKDEILERYLNEVYWGEGAYGIEMAARVYFNKTTQNLTLAEGAMLAGMISAPSVYSPHRNRDATRKRQRTVLDRMVRLRMITPAEAQRARSAHLMVKLPQISGLTGVRAPYFVSFVLPTLLERFGEEQVYRGGLHIYTTLDPKLQAIAERVVRKGIDRATAQKLRIEQAALVALDPHTGQVKAMVGGYDFKKSQFNRAWQARRQPGSSFKPFIYITALAQGASPDRVLEDAPAEYKTGDPKRPLWRPRNYDNKFRGQVTLREALEHSINVPTVRVLHDLGPRRVAEYAGRMGITSHLRPDLSLALGTSEVTPLEMAAAYGVLATLGVRAEPHAILRVTDASGKVLYQAQPRVEPVVSPALAYVMTDILKGVIRRGTGTVAAIGRPAAGKTGTTDDHRNAWFIGYTPQLSTAVWMGNDDNSPMRGVVGGGPPAATWAAFMREALTGIPPTDWDAPDGTAPSEPTPVRPPVEPPMLIVDSPADGAAVQMPVMIQGRAPARTAVTILITAERSGLSVALMETFAPVDDFGRFSFQFAPSDALPDVTYTITLTVTVPAGGTTTRSLTITETPSP